MSAVNISATEIFSKCVSNVMAVKIRGYLWKEGCGLLCCRFMEPPCIAGLLRYSPSALLCYLLAILGMKQMNYVYS